MCGIVGYLGGGEAAGPLVQGLRRLEFLGYDSAGLATAADGRVHVRKAADRVDRLAELVAASPPPGSAGIGHTRWATHGRPSAENAHPHLDQAGRIALAHNGVIENHASLRTFLERQGVSFQSETDTEALVQLIGFFYSQTGELLGSVRGALREVRGTFGIVLLCADAPHTLIAARRGSPMLVAAGPEELIVASDPAAAVGRVHQITRLEDDEIALLGPNGVSIGKVEDRRSATRAVPERLVPLDAASDEASLEGHADHMHKEIFEQPETLRNAMRGRLRRGDDRVTLGGLKGLTRELSQFRRALLFGCGTSWHAALIGKYLFEELGGLPAEVDYASELRYRNPLVEEGTIAVAISQSGETADTVAALREVRTRGAVGIGVVNAVGGAITRETDAGVYLHAGPEIGVASTKAFSAQVAVLAMIALDLGRRRRLSPERTSTYVDELLDVPEKVASALRLEPQVAAIARRLADRQNWLYLGRGVNLPVAFEGALKLKEVSYVHAEGLPAAEVKHGPVAMIDAGMPVVAIAPRDRTYEKVLANIVEVRERGGHVIAVASEGDRRIAEVADEVLFVPETPPLLSPLVTNVPLQLLAYHVAIARKHDVDKPRHLSKSVAAD